MSFLGTRYPIVYEARNLESGITMTTVRILRPGDSSPIGPFTMVELPSPLNGRYVFNYEF